MELCVVLRVASGSRHQSESSQFGESDGLPKSALKLTATQNRATIKTKTAQKKKK